MKPRKKILIIIAGVVTALLLIANTFISNSETVGFSESGRVEVDLNTF